MTNEERKELKELYESYKNVKDLESLKLLAGLIKTSKWYENNKLTYNCLWNSPSDYDLVDLKFIFDNLYEELYRNNRPVPLITIFLKSLITRKGIIYKPI